MMETKARMRAAVFGICVNLCLFMVKLYVGISTNSISIYVDSLNNALDSVVCIIALVGFWLSVRTSPKYPFGLGRAEDLTGFITAVVIVGTGFGFGYVSLERTLYPAPVWFSVRYAVIIAVTAVVKLLLGAYYKFKDRRHPSPVLKGLFTDSVLDFFITLSTLISFTLTRVAGVPVDGYFGIAIRAVLLISGAKSCVSSFACILGKRETEDCDRAQALLTAQPGVTGVANVQCHRYGRHLAFTADITTDQMTVEAVAQLQEGLRALLQTEMGADFTAAISPGTSTVQIEQNKNGGVTNV